ncbi:MAG: hypothetical protein Q7S17_05755 [Xanthobacteraceae bacterium]|nr:hypothetical protein [Xanthobacteraceae bacterium]
MTKFVFIILAVMIISLTAEAQDRTPWQEPPIGPLSTVGTVIDIENYHCTVNTPRSMTCLNVGRVCVEKRARDEIRDARRFGCAIKSSKNYPCPPDDNDRKKDGDKIGTCHPMMIGGW